METFFQYLVVFALQAAGFAASPIAGHLSDRMGRRRVTTTSRTGDPRLAPAHSATTAPMTATAIARSNGWSAWRMSTQFAPRTVPAYTSSIDQGRAPAVEYTMNRPSGIRATPAGKLMNVRMTGSNRPMNTVAPP